MTEIASSEPLPIRIGLANLDTTHPQGYVPVIRALGHQVVGVFDGGTVFGAGYAPRFAARNSIARCYEDLSELARDVDVAYVGGCDWTARLRTVRLLADAGVGILLDKPAAASWRELDQLEDLVRSGARITGGSALLWCDEVRNWVQEHGSAVTALSSGSGHELDYGVHAAALVVAACGPGVRQVQAARVAGAQVVDLLWAKGHAARYVMTGGQLQPAYAVTVVGGDVVSHLVPDLDGLHRGLLRPTLTYLAGRAPAGRPYRDVIEPERICLAALASLRGAGRWVHLDDPEDADLVGSAFDAAKFTRNYREQRLEAADAGSPRRSEG